MKFFKPVVQLAYEHELDQPKQYFLHVVTFCPRTTFRAGSYTTSDAELSTGLLLVEVEVIEDANLPRMEYITPVVHTISLGAIAFPEEEGWIQVTVVGHEPQNTASERDGGPGTTTRTGGSGTVSTTEADDNARPLDDTLLF